MKRTEFPPSVQSDLFNYLKPEQQEFIKPVLRVFKKSAQERLCCALLDYMETGEATHPADFTLGTMFMYLTRNGMPENDNPNDKRIIRPLHISKPRTIGSIIRQVFGRKPIPQHSSLNYNH